MSLFSEKERNKEGFKTVNILQEINLSPQE